MIVNKVLASYTFRVMFVYVAGLSIAGLIVLNTLYMSYSYEYFHELRGSVSSEIESLQIVYESKGGEGVDNLIDEKIRLGELNQFVYLVVDDEFKKIAGNLESWPKFKNYGDDWLSYQIDLMRWDESGSDTAFIASSKLLDNGDSLLVARHYYDIIFIANMVRGVLTRSMIVTIVLGTIGGAIVAGLSVSRIDNINKSVKRIMSGDLSERINVVPHQGDYRELTSNLNRMLDRIQTLMEGVRQVSDNIAHDLRTPLTRLRNNLSLLQGEVQESTEESVQNLIEEADDLLSTFSALLRIAHIESGNQRAGFGELDTKTILLDVIELYEPLASAKSITMRQNLADCNYIQGDRDLIFQALANLIDNAIKYTPAHGYIDVNLSSDNSGITVQIADTGLGIPELERSKVFRRFFRVESSRGLQPGNGLGLSLVSAVIKLHHGEIALNDNNPGLSIDVFLPV